MKYAIFFIVFFISVNAQKTKFDSVVIKLKKDKVSYNQFIEFGRIYCLEDKSYDLDEEYNSKYNSLYPLPRLISFDAFKVQFDIYNKKHQNKKCECLYKPNKYLQKRYTILVENRKNYNKEPEYDIENYMKDFLENYYIRIQTK